MFVAFLLGEENPTFIKLGKKGERIKLVLVSKRHSVEKRLQGNFIYCVSTGWASVTFRKWIKALQYPASGCLNY